MPLRRNRRGERTRFRQRFRSLVPAYKKRSFCEGYLRQAAVKEGSFSAQLGEHVIGQSLPSRTPLRRATQVVDQNIKRRFALDRNRHVNIGVAESRTGFVSQRAGPVSVRRGRRVLWLLRRPSVEREGLNKLRGSG